MVQCTGTVSGLDAVGARVSVQVGNRSLSAEVLGSSGYLSQGDTRLHFGLGADTTYQGIEVRWPDGTRERFGGGKANEIVVLKQGTGTRIPGTK